MEQEKSQNEIMPVTLSNYSKRVILKDIVGRSDGGAGLVGHRVVIGGWVKSSREVKKEGPVQPPPVEPADAVGPKGVSCVEVLQSRIPFLRSIIKVLGVGDHRICEKLDAVINKPPQPSIAFLQVSDGSCAPSLQVTVESAIAPPIQLMPTGSCIMAEGILQQPTIKGKQVIELKVEELLHVGTVDQKKYPLSKKRLPLEMLRDCSHFRSRTTTVASVNRIYSAFNLATHTFFQNHGFLYVQVPIITCTDSEGFSKKFQVTTLFNKVESVPSPFSELPNHSRKLKEQLLGEEAREKESKLPRDDTEGVSLEAVKASIKEKGKQVEELKRSESNKEALAAAVQDLKKTNALVAQLESREKAKSGNVMKAEKANFSEDFFSHQAYLTVSGHLHLESFACSLGNVYTLGPRFLAERSESKRSLAEMWMVELEMAFTQLEDAMECGAEFLKFACKWILDNCPEDLNFVAKRIDKTVVDRLQSVVSSSFEKTSYAEAVEILKQATEQKFEARVEYGVSLTEEQESYLADEIFKKPVIIYNYPKELKPFYVRLNQDGNTVAAFDVIVPKVGNIIRGSQKEERLNVLVKRMQDLGLGKQEYEWYLDLRRHGTAKHSGFSLSLDRLVHFASGLNDIKDVVPFPRSYGIINN